MKSSPSFIERLPRGRNGFLCCLALAALVCVPSLFMGFFIDDYLHLLTVEGRFDLASPLDVFRFAGGDADELKRFMNEGPLPWFTYLDIKLHFYRPLSSLLMLLDNRLFGDAAFLYHLHSLIWYVALVALAGLLYRRSLGPAALVAMALYALDEAHVIPAVWWSNRNALVAAVPALAGFLAHLRWREAGWRWGLPLSLLGYAVGFAGAEAALGIMGYLGAYELLGRRDAWQRRIGALLPAALLSVLYLGWYKAKGYGVSGSGVYIDPIHEFADFAALAPGRLAMMLSNQFLTLPIEAPVVVRGLELPLVLLSAGVLAAFALLMRPAWREADAETRRALTWLMAGAVLSTAPTLATFPSGRLMTLPSLGTAAALAILLCHAWSRRAGKPWRALALLLLFVHAAGPLAIWTGLPVLFARLDDTGRAAILDPAIAREDARDVSQIALNPPDPFVGMYPYLVRLQARAPMPATWQVLSLAPHAHRYTRVDDRTLEMEIIDGEMFTMLFEQLVRSPKRPMLPGDTVDVEAFRARVIDVGEYGPTRVRFTFKKSLDDPSIELLEWGGKGFRRLAPPPVGESVLLEKSTGITSPAYILGLK